MRKGARQQSPTETNSTNDSYSAKLTDNSVYRLMRIGQKREWVALLLDSSSVFTVIPKKTPL